MDGVIMVSYEFKVVNNFANFLIFVNLLYKKIVKLRFVVLPVIS